MKSQENPKPIYLKDYRPPEFFIPEVKLHFDLHDEFTRVTSKLSLTRNTAIESTGTLALNGEGLKPLRVAIDGRELKANEYEVTSTHLIIPNVPDRFELEVETRIEPHKNLSCEGLYKSSGMFCTQCEAESFRKITYFLDRPDVMSVYTVTIEADKAKYPILLSNGNSISKRDLGNGRHEAVWHDPFKKPSYLFALVAGDLGVLEDRYTTRSGREVKLQIFVRKGLESRCQHAMDSLKWAMKWDEDTYGLEYDLDTYMIVVADDFNMGAMENKGLNIFNANYVLAHPETATDHDFTNITAIVGHEYFHNWTGNRVTCRDWFQLSLKEGLTVFRDQNFSADMSSPAVRRIEDVTRLRTHQFAEDAGPMAHPVRPQSYITIDNFYTLTVYEKGAEVIRMIETIVGREGFRKGMDLYFQRHDGQAVTTDDFVAAMADANGLDLTQFKNWYDQAGTPVIKVRTEHDPEKQTYTLHIEQSCPPTPGQPEKKPFHIPVAIGLVGPDGRDMKLQLESASSSAAAVSNGRDENTLVLHVREPKQSFVFNGVREKPVLSLLRGFSAPVRTEYDYTNEELAFLIRHDSDSFCRWEAAQTLAVRMVKELVAEKQAGRPLTSGSWLIDSFASIISDRELDPAFASYMLRLPASQYLAQFFNPIDVEAIHEAREHLTREIALRYKNEFANIYADLSKRDTSGFTPLAAGLRALKNTALYYLSVTEEESHLELAIRQRREAKTMTEELGALEALSNVSAPVRDTAFEEFYAKWKHETLVINKWFTVQAVSTRPDTLERVRKLATDPLFDKNNPNKIYSLYTAFCRYNQLRFNDPSGAGYRLIADQILEIDERNPQVASSLMAGFSHWRKLDGKRQALIRTELERILAKPGLSSNVYELASKMLNG